MSVAPLFVASMAEIKARTRLTGVKPGGEELIEDALEGARVWFYRRLGITRTAEVLAYGYSEAPTTETGILRSLANQTEIKMVRAGLLRTMSTLQRDGSGQARAMWNQEGMWRNKGAEEVRQEIARLTSEIEDAMDLLSGVEQIGEDSGIRVSSFGGTSRSGPPGIRLTTF